MDKTLIDYEKNLEELERQKEKLQKLMQMMGQEWEESGPGIGWLGQVDTPLDENSNCLATETIETSVTPLTISNEPLFTHILSSQTGPSPEYLQSLLNVNEALLAESLTNDSSSSSSPPPPSSSKTNILTLLEEDLVTPLITPKDAMLFQKDFYDMDTTENILRSSRS